ARFSDATAGRAWITSPMAPNRTTRIPELPVARSDMVNQISCALFIGSPFADYVTESLQQLGRGAGNGHHVVYHRQRGRQLRARAMFHERRRRVLDDRENRAAAIPYGG